MATSAKADGWIIKVPMLTMAGNPGMDDIYAVWESNAVDALRKVEQKYSLTPDQIPETVKDVDQRTLRGLGLKQPGDCEHIYTVS